MLQCNGCCCERSVAWFLSSHSSFFLFLISQVCVEVVFTVSFLVNTGNPLGVAPFGVVVSVSHTSLDKIEKMSEMPNVVQ
jgi:hypothetical protein